jgi:hypothetical protein
MNALKSFLRARGFVAIGNEPRLEIRGNDL